jgi:hypothetical protein
MPRGRARRFPRIPATCLALLGVLGVVRPARADWDFQLATNLNGAWMRRAPTLTVAPVTTGAREMGQGEIRQRSGVAMIGVGGDLELTVDDRWRVPLAGGYVYWAVGSYDGVVTGHDGSIAHLRPWSSSRVDVLLPGFGRRWKHRRWMYGVAARTGISWFDMNGTVAAGGDRAPLDLGAQSFVFQIEVEACRRLDPTTRVCAQVAPRVYDHEFLNGLTLGVRMEWGR